MDLGDGELQRQYEEYMDQLHLIDSICRPLDDPQHRKKTCADLCTLQHALKNDGEFIDEGICRHQNLIRFDVYKCTVHVNMQTIAFLCTLCSSKGGYCQK